MRVRVDFANEPPTITADGQTVGHLIHEGISWTLYMGTRVVGRGYAQVRNIENDVRKVLRQRAKAQERVS